MAAKPALTKTGKIRLTSLTLQQLEDMLSKSSKPKERDKIQRRINVILKEHK